MTASTPPERPTALIVDPGNLPPELRTLRQWVCWDFVQRTDKPDEWTKVPLSPTTQRRASSTDPHTWATFDEAMGRADRDGLPGVGFVFTADDPYVGIDLDKCRDRKSGELNEWATPIVRDLASYAEVSASGTGVHIITKGKLPAGDNVRRRTGAIEMYDSDRYFVMTGHKVVGTPATVESRQSELDALYTRTFSQNGRQEPHQPTTRLSILTDEEVIANARDARNGSKFLALWGGDTSDYAGDDSAAELALLSLLSFWTQDTGQLDRLFRRSGLMRDKWERADYRQRTIGRALKRSDVWEPGPQPTMHAANGYHPEGAPTGEPATVVEFPIAKKVEPIPWPVLDDAALIGLAGDVVRAVDPHTEGDPVAGLINYLVMFGSAVGATPHALVGDRLHRANENAVLVGDTSKGRKGTSHDTPQAIVQAAASDSDWGQRVQGGLSSGEGVIWAVRDPIEGEKKGETITVDAGVNDKRLMLVEEEFSAVLKVAGREGNILSEIIRRSWDGKPLQILTKSRGATCGAPHIAILGHITKTELQRELTDTSAANGFGNRFLWVCVKRSKLLPEGGALADDERHDLVRRTREAIIQARRVGTVRRNEQARGLWAEIYGDLSSSSPGLWGALTDRAEAHVLRLSLLYALLDGSAVIRAEHLIAALAVWDYCAASAKHIFGDSTGDPIADRVLTALRSNGPMAQGEIVDLLGRHVNSGRLGKAFESLILGGLARMQREETAGRPRTMWSAA